MYLSMPTSSSILLKLITLISLIVYSNVLQSDIYAECHVVYNLNGRNMSFRSGTYNRTGVNSQTNYHDDFNNVMLTVPVYGNLHEYAYYYVHLYIGNPKQKQMLILDTGSSIINFACSGCKYCGKHKLAKYDPKMSKTSSFLTCSDAHCKNISGICNAKTNTCGFVEAYYEGSSASGLFIKDVVSFDPNHNLSSFYNHIGCIYQENDLIYSQITNGIFGIGPISSDKTSPNNFLEHFLNEHYTRESRIFSLCLSEIGGLMTIGGYLTDANAIMNWIPLIRSDMYNITVNAISFDNYKIDIGKKTFVIDSGSTMSLLDDVAYNIIRRNLQKLCLRYKSSAFKKFRGLECINDYTNGPCFSDISKMPIIRLHANGNVIIDWHPRSYFINRTAINRKLHPTGWWCLGINKSSTGDNILGATFFKNNKIVFDLNKNRLGVNPTDCPLN